MKAFSSYHLKELLQSIAEGDEFAFRIVFDNYKNRFYAVALKMTRSDTIAQEMVQDIFLKIWQNRTSLASIDNPEAYFFTTLYHLIYKYYKKLSLERKMLKLISESPQFRNITDETVLAQESEKLISEAIAKLPPQQQLVFKLSKHDGLNREQIAEQLHISPHTVRNHMAEAVRFIRNYLDRAAVLPLLLVLHLVK